MVMRLICLLLTTQVLWGGTSSSAQTSHSLPANAAADSVSILLSPKRGTLSALQQDAAPSHSLRRLHLSPSAAAVLGGVVGAAAGYAWMSIRCRDRFCEMGELVGILGGAVVGGALGYVLAGGGPPSTRPNNWVKTTDSRAFFWRGW